MKMKLRLKKDLIKEALTKQIDKIYPSKEALEAVLRSGKKLIIYWGIDPTAPSLHVAHGANLFILRRFQNLNHEVVVLLGDFTAQIGDPSGKHKKRVPLTEKQTLLNLKNYKEQIFKILNPQKTTIKFNSEWWKKMSAKNLLNLAKLVTHRRIINRSMFQERIKRGDTVTVEELLYPIIQGYDSVALSTDIELGGTDQLFNMLVGRDLEKMLLKKEKFIITKPILAHPKTGEMLMSKTSGGAVFVSEPANQMFNKIMVLPDEVIVECFKLCTDLEEKKIKEFESRFKVEENPLDLKIELAHEVVKIYHGEKKAKEAKKEFERVFQKHKLPKNIPPVTTKKGRYNIVDLLVEIGLAPSKSQARRLVTEGAVKINGNIFKNSKTDINIIDGMIVRVGKKHFRKIKVKY